MTDIECMNIDLADEGHPPVRTHIVICSRCKGTGELRGWPGAYTESDRAEWSEEDYEDYLTTTRPCEDCGDMPGRRVEILDEEYDRPEVQRYLREMASLARMEAQERFYGA